jgi:hypothetical protein
LKPWKRAGGKEVQLYSFFTSALDEEEWPTLSPSLLISGQRTLVPIAQEAGWDPEPGWPFWKRERFLAPVADRTPDHPARSLITVSTTFCVVPVFILNDNIKTSYKQDINFGIEFLWPRI